MLKPPARNRSWRNLGWVCLFLLGLAAVFTPASLPSREVGRPAEPFSEGGTVPTAFNHDLHEERAGLTECTVCHHHAAERREASSGPRQPGRPCSDCHSHGDAKPQLKYAFHSMCIACHQTADAAPLTCQGCHPGLGGQHIHDPGFLRRQRPPSVFDHRAHTTEHRIDSCSACHHLSVSSSRLTYSIPGQECSDCHLLEMGHSSMPDLQEAYHRLCLECHQQRRQGALACGECHVRE